MSRYIIEPTRPLHKGAWRVLRVDETGGNTHRTEIARYRSRIIAATITRMLNGFVDEEVGP